MKDARNPGTRGKRRRQQNTPAVADDRRGAVTDQDVDTAGTDADDTRDAGASDSTDDIGSTFVEHDQLFPEHEGLRRAPARAPASTRGVADDKDAHTEATMGPGEGQDPKRNTM